MRALLLLPALAATTVAASSDVSPCLGEYQLDPVSGQCDLAANGGDLDEPMASSRSCRPHEYLCPDLQTCVGTAADFAGCSTPRRLQRSPSKCSLVQSDWDCGGVQCDIVPGPANDFVVTNNQSGFLWHTGKAQMSGDGRVNVSYFKDNSNTPFTSTTEPSGRTVTSSRGTTERSGTAIAMTIAVQRVQCSTCTSLPTR